MGNWWARLLAAVRRWWVSLECVYCEQWRRHGRGPYCPTCEELARARLRYAGLLDWWG